MIKTAKNVIIHRIVSYNIVGKHNEEEHWSMHTHHYSVVDLLPPKIMTPYKPKLWQGIACIYAFILLATCRSIATDISPI